MSSNLAAPTIVITLLHFRAMIRPTGGAGPNPGGDCGLGAGVRRAPGDSPAAGGMRLFRIKFNELNI